MEFDQLNGLEFKSYSLKKEAVSVRSLREKSASNIIKAIEASKTIPFERVLFGLGIRFVGKTVAEKLADHFLSIEKLKLATLDELKNVPEIGERIAESVVKFFAEEKNRNIIAQLRESQVQLTSIKKEIILESSNLEDKSFLISGVFSQFSREELKEKIKANGGKIVSSISGKLDFLVAGDKMGPSKLEKATKLGINIISEDEFLNMI